MESGSFRYVVYLRTTPEALWRALTDGTMTPRYWFGRRVESAWTRGAPVKFWVDGGHGLDVSGEVLEVDRPHALTYSWRVEYDAEMRAAGATTVAFSIAPLAQGVVRMGITHTLPANQRLADGIARGWPAIASSLKSLLETGTPLTISPDECQA